MTTVINEFKNQIFVTQVKDRNVKCDFYLTESFT